MTNEEFFIECKQRGLVNPVVYESHATMGMPGNPGYHLVLESTGRLMACKWSLYDAFDATEFDRAIKRLYYMFMEDQCPIARWFVKEMER